MRIKTHIHAIVVCTAFLWQIMPCWAHASPSTTQAAPTDITPRSYTIQEIKVTGNRSLASEAVIAISGLQVGDTIQLPGLTTQKAIQRLWKQGLIQDASIYITPTQGGSAILTIAITEIPRLIKYTFKNITKKERKALLEQVPLEKGQAVSSQLIKRLRKALIKQLSQGGYRNATVSVTSTRDPEQANGIHLTIEVNKGKKYLIHAIHIHGNHSIDSDTLKAKMQHTREKARLTLFQDILHQIVTLKPIRKGGVLWRPPTLEGISSYVKKHFIASSTNLEDEKFEQDKKHIIAFYQSQGFRDARIVASSVKPVDDNLLDIHLTIEEGQKYYVRSIRWVGNKRYKASKLSDVLAVKPGDVYNPLLIQQQLNNSPTRNDVAGLYADDGHLFFHALPVEVGIVGNAIDLEIRIQEGPKAYINKIIIEGNKWTHDHVIRRELRTLPGDLFSRAKIQRSVREVALLELTDPAAMGIIPIPNQANGTVDIKYKIKEKPKGDLQGSLSYGGKEFVGGITTHFNNFSLQNALKGRFPVGDGQTIGLSFRYNGKDYRNLSLQFTEPWLGGKRPSRLHFGINGSYYELPADIDRYVDKEKRDKERAKVPLFQNGRPTITKLLSNDQLLTKVYTLGLQLSWGTRLRWPDDYFFVNGSMSFLREAYEDYTPPGIKQKRGDGVINDIHASLSISRNSIDIPMYPREGSVMEFYASITPPYTLWSDNTKLFQAEKNTWKEYHKWLLSGTFYRELFHKCVVSLNGQAGFLGSFSSKKEVGPFKRFYMGGTTFNLRSFMGRENIALRGYPDSSIAPEDKEIGYKGGVVYQKLSAELRYPIIEESLCFIYGLAFAEAGNTWAKYSTCNPLALKRSVGFGIRAQVVMLGEIGVHWGYGFDKLLKEGDANQLEFHVSMGGSAR